MDIDWTKPLELMDGTPLRLEVDCPYGNPDADGDYWLEHDDGESKVLDPSDGAAYRYMCVSPKGESIKYLRNRKEPTA